MKKYLAIILLLTAFGSAHAQMKMLYEKEKSEKERIEKFIESGSSRILVYRIDVDESESDTSLVLKIEISGDKKTVSESGDDGTLITGFGADGNISYREVIDKEGKITGKTLYKYNSKGLIVKRDLYFGLTKAGEEIYNFKDDNTGEMKFFTADEMVMGSSTFRFDGNNKLTEEVIFGASGKMQQRYEYIYDSNGRISEERYYNEEGLMSTQSYTYDENDNVVEMAAKDNSGKIMSFKRYGFEGKQLTEELQEGDDIKIRIQYFYKDGIKDLVKLTDLEDMSVYYVKFAYE